MSKQKDRPCPSCEGTGLIGGSGINDRCDDCNGTGIAKGCQKDRPDKETIKGMLGKLFGMAPLTIDEVTQEIIALFPDYKTYISKLISDHQEAISNLHLEIAEAKKQAITQTVDYLGNHYCIMAPESMVKEIEKQVLKEAK